MSKIKLNNIITKVLLSLIFILSSLIYINKSDENKEKYNNIVFKNTLDFNKLNNYLNRFIDKKLLFVKNKSQTVFNESNETITYFSNGTKIEYNSETLIYPKESGIVVSIGDTEYGNTIIVQGIDGYDIWYCNISNSDLKIYDYITKDTSIGSTNELIMIIKKDNEYISYEKYQNKI